MTKSKKTQSTIDQAKGLQHNSPDIRVVFPKAIPNAVSAALNGQPMQRLQYDETKERQEEKANWYSLESLSDTVRSHIGNTAIQLNESIQLVQAIPVIKEVKRFELNVKGVEADLNKFTNDYLAIRARHEGRNGIITDEEEYALFMSIFEDYNALISYFDGTFHNKLIEFTSFALEAKDALIAQQKAESQVNTENTEA